MPGVFLLRQDPVLADAVVVVGGDELGGRFRKGAQLVRDGYAPKLFVVDHEACTHGRCFRWSEGWRGSLPGRDRLAEWLPREVREAVEPLLDDVPISVGTFEEATAAWERLEPRGVRTILLVTDEIHSRRAASVWRKVTGSQAAVVSVPCSELCIGVESWWQSERGAELMWMELPKAPAYFFSGYLW